MSLVVGQNSWVTVAEADIYLGDKIKAIEWFNLSELPSNPGEVAKESLLITAFYWLSGSPELSISPTLTDSNVKNAQIEAAWFLYNYYDEYDARRAAIFSGLKSFQYSKRSEDLVVDQIGIPDYIIGMLRDYGIKNTTALLLGEYDE